ncbi:protein FAM200B-like [Diabrotica undecimpunctata]|uniref:protein FAM200B-like n=1 Tax=Diabrotica undecimpunctata TaxID=50387 RepID=UPI003B63E670
MSTTLAASVESKTDQEVVPGVYEGKPRLSLSESLVINELPWEKVIGICTDGAQAMTGCRSGFMELAKKKNPRIIGSHCIIHRQALASQTLPEPLNVTLNLAIKIVNHIKSSALNTRLLQALCQELNSDQETLLSHRSPVVIQRKYACKII